MDAVVDQLVLGRFLADSWKILDILSSRGVDTDEHPNETYAKRKNKMTKTLLLAAAGCCWLLLGWQPGSQAA